MLQKTNSQEYKDGSPSAAPSREIETSKKWLHDYLLGQDEDDFRNRFFKKVDSIAELEAQRVVKKQQAAAKAAIANSTPQYTARGRACPIDEASLSQLLPETTGHITKYSSQEGIDRWMARSFDDCRRDYIHTLMDRRMFGKMASREQKIVIFDWDDTLICTTHLGKMQGLAEMKFTEKDMKIFAKIDETAVQ